MKTHAMFGDHMVLQRGKPIRVFGEGEGEVVVTLAGHSARARGDSRGWLVELPPTEAGGPYEMTVEGDGARKVLRDVYVGDVFLIAGQSNMQFRVDQGPAPEHGCADAPSIRYYHVRRPEEEETPQDGCWRLCAPEEATHWSAIGYHLALEWQTKHGVPVGLVACFQGASMIQSWMDETQIAGTDLDLPEASKHSNIRDFPQWNGDGHLYHAMFRTVTPYTFRAVIWYQGESNTSPAEGRVYDRLLRAMIERWRSDLQDETRFVIVQIHGFSDADLEGWRLVREAQARAAQSVPNCALVRTQDLGETLAMHPTRKQPVAARVVSALER